MNILDLVIAALCIGFAVYGIFQGIVRQAFSLGGLILGHLAGVHYGAAAQNRLSLDFSHSEVVAYVLVFVITYVLVRLGGFLVERLVRASALSGSDRFAGMVMGFAKGVLLSVLLVFLLVILLPPDAPLVARSKLAPTAVTGARVVEKVFPRRWREAFDAKAFGRVAPPASRGGSPPASQPKNRSKK